MTYELVRNPIAGNFDVLRDGEPAFRIAFNDEAFGHRFVANLNTPPAKRRDQDEDWSQAIALLRHIQSQ